MVTGAVSPGIKQPGREANRSPPSNAEFKNGGAIPSLTHTSSWRSAELVMHGDKFTFYNHKLADYYNMTREVSITELLKY
jgi:hypothetical protein